LGLLNAIKGGFEMKTSEILPGDLLFVSGKGIIKSLIEWITHSKYYHVAVFCDEGKTLMEAQGGRKSGTTPLSDYLNTKDKLVIYRDNTLTSTEREKIVTYALENQGLEYDYIGILAELFRYEMHISLDDYNEGKKRICSSFVRDCGLAAGRLWSLEKVPSPQDLIAGKKLKRIGKLKK
jgi:hypothetical protein